MSLFLDELIHELGKFNILRENCYRLLTKGKNKLVKNFQRIFLILSWLTSIAIADPIDEGLRLIYLNKQDDALKILEPLAQQSNPKAAFYTALLLIHGEKPNIPKGLRLLEQAVSAGYGPALDTYAGFYLHGDFVDKDVHKAKMYYEIAGRRGYGPSQFNYGIMCKNGDGVPLDPETAYIFLSLAADNYHDLEDLTLDATEFRDEVKEKLPPDVLARADKTLKELKKGIIHKKINND